MTTAITAEYGKHGKTVEVEGLNAASLQMRERMAGKLGGGP